MSIIDTVKRAQGIASSKLADSELDQIFQQLREEALALQEEVVTLKEKLVSADAQGRPTLEYDGCVYWKTGGTTNEGPFCQHCHDQDGKLIRVQEYVFDYDGDGRKKKHWKCLSCNNLFAVNSPPT